MSLSIDNTDFEFFFINKNIDTRGPEIFFGKGLFFLSYNCNNFVTYYNENFLAGDKSYMCLYTDDRIQSGSKDSNLNIEDLDESRARRMALYNQEDEALYSIPKLGDKYSLLGNSYFQSDKILLLENDMKLLPSDNSQVFSEKLTGGMQLSSQNSGDDLAMIKSTISVEVKNLNSDKIESIQKQQLGVKTIKFSPINEDDSEYDGSGNFIEKTFTDKLSVAESIEPLSYSNTKKFKKIDNLTMGMEDDSSYLEKVGTPLELKISPPELAKRQSMPLIINSCQPTEEAINITKLHSLSKSMSNREKTFFNQESIKQEQNLKQEANPNPKQQDKLFVLKNNDLFFEIFDFKTKLNEIQLLEDVSYSQSVGTKFAKLRGNSSQILDPDSDNRITKPQIPACNQFTHTQSPMESHITNLPKAPEQNTKNREFINTQSKVSPKNSLQFELKVKGHLNEDKIKEKLHQVIKNTYIQYIMESYLHFMIIPKNSYFTAKRNLYDLIGFFLNFYNESDGTALPTYFHSIDIAHKLMKITIISRFQHMCQQFKEILTQFTSSSVIQIADGKSITEAPSSIFCDNCFYYYAKVNDVYVYSGANLDDFIKWLLKNFVKEKLFLMNEDLVLFFILCPAEILLLNKGEELLSCKDSSGNCPDVELNEFYGKILQAHSKTRNFQKFDPDLNPGINPTQSQTSHPNSSSQQESSKDPPITPRRSRAHAMSNLNLSNEDSEKVEANNTFSLKMPVRRFFCLFQVGFNQISLKSYNLKETLLQQFEESFGNFATYSEIRETAIKYINQEKLGIDKDLTNIKKIQKNCFELKSSLTKDKARNKQKHYTDKSRSNIPSSKDGQNTRSLTKTIIELIEHDKPADVGVTRITDKDKLIPLSEMLRDETYRMSVLYAVNNLTFLLINCYPIATSMLTLKNINNDLDVSWCGLLAKNYLDFAKIYFCYKLEEQRIKNVL